MEEREVCKLEQAIEVHGYRGASKKKHNGIVPIRDSDKQLLKSLHKYEEMDREFIKKQVSDGCSELPLMIKGVAHCPSGTRIVGLMYSKTGLIIMLGFANYGYQLF
jgi:hypothetical protein